MDSRLPEHHRTRLGGFIEDEGAGRVRGKDGGGEDGGKEEKGRRREEEGWRDMAGNG